MNNDLFIRLILFGLLIGFALTPVMDKLIENTFPDQEQLVVDKKSLTEYDF